MFLKMSFSNKQKDSGGFTTLRKDPGSQHFETLRLLIGVMDEGIYGVLL